MIKHTLSGYSTRLRPFHHCHCLLHCLTIVMTQWGPKSFCYCKAILPSLRGQKQSLNAKVAVTSKWKRFQSQNGVTFFISGTGRTVSYGWSLKDFTTQSIMTTHPNKSICFNFDLYLPRAFFQMSFDRNTKKWRNVSCFEKVGVVILWLVCLVAWS